MSAPDTNLERQRRRHIGPLIGMAVAAIFGCFPQITFAQNNGVIQLSGVASRKVGRFCGIDPEEAITLTCEKFIRRFRAMEQAALERGQSLEQLSLDEMTALWNGAKHS